MNAVVSHLVLAQSPHVELFLSANEDTFIDAKSKLTSSSSSWLPLLRSAAVCHPSLRSD